MIRLKKKYSLKKSTKKLCLHQKKNKKKDLKNRKSTLTKKLNQNL